MKTLIIVFLFFAVGCGGDGGEVETPQSSVIQCGDITVTVPEASEIVDAAAENGVEVEGDLPENNIPDADPGAQETIDIDGSLKQAGVIVAACGSSVSNSESSTVVHNPQLSPAQRLIADIHAGNVVHVEVLQ